MTPTHEIVMKSLNEVHQRAVELRKIVVKMKEEKLRKEGEE